MKQQPPKWIDWIFERILDPEYKDEIQGDALELYYERLEINSYTLASFYYLLDLLRFLTSDVKNPSKYQQPTSFFILAIAGLKILKRRAGKQKLLFSVKSFSLSICMAFALLLATLAIQENSYDQHLSKAKSIFNINAETTILGDVTNYAPVPTALIHELKKLPQVETGTQISLLHSLHQYEVGDKVFNAEKGLLADGEFAEMFELKFIHGSAKALNEPDNMVLTSSTARKFFGDKDPINQIVSFNNGEWFDVVGVVEDPPVTSHLQYDLLISSSSFSWMDSWTDFNGYQYIQVVEGSDLGLLKSQIDNILLGHKKEISETVKISNPASFDVHSILRNVRSLHLWEGEMEEEIGIHRSPSNIRFILLLSILFFGLGVFHYWNITMTDLRFQTKQMHVLRVIGGHKMGEKTSALGLTLMNAAVLIPLISMLFFGGNKLLASKLYWAIDANTFQQPLFLVLIGSVLVTFLFISLLAYWILRQSRNGKKQTSSMSDPIFTQANQNQSLIAQLVLSTAMIIFTLVVIDQFNYLRDADLGFEDEQVITIELPVVGYENGTGSIIDQFLKIPGVEMASQSSYGSLYKTEYFEIDRHGNKEGFVMDYQTWGYDYLDIMGIDLVVGRNFQRDLDPIHQRTFMINESAADYFGWKDPINQTLFDESGDPGKVVGVFKDFHHSSLHEAIEPMVVWLEDDQWAYFLFLKTSNLRNGETIRELTATYHSHFPSTPFQWSFLDQKIQNQYQADAQLKALMELGLFISLLTSAMAIMTMSWMLLNLRLKEMSIRKIVGATLWQLFGLHAKRFLVFTFIAIGIAVPLSYLLAKSWLESFAYRIDLSLGYFIIPALVFSIVIIMLIGTQMLKLDQKKMVNALKE